MLLYAFVNNAVMDRGRDWKDKELPLESKRRTAMGEASDGECCHSRQ